MEEAFAERLIRTRRGKGLQPGALADSAGIPRSRLRDLESGNAQPTAEELQSLSAVLEVTPDFLEKGGTAVMNTQGNAPDDVASALNALSGATAQQQARTQKAGGFVDPSYLQAQAAKQVEMAARARAQQQQAAAPQPQKKRAITKVELGRLMEETRKARNIPYKTITAALGISLGEYILLEEGKGDITHELFAKIKQFFEFG